MRNKKKECLAFYLFISPWLIGFVLLNLIPMVYSLYTSFTNWDGILSPSFTGWSNYKEVFNDSLFYKSMLNTF